MKFFQIENIIQKTEEKKYQKLYSNSFLKARANYLAEARKIYLFYMKNAQGQRDNFKTQPPHCLLARQDKEGFYVLPTQTQEPIEWTKPRSSQLEISSIWEKRKHARQYSKGYFSGEVASMLNFRQKESIQSQGDKEAESEKQSFMGIQVKQHRWVSSKPLRRNMLGSSILIWRREHQQQKALPLQSPCLSLLVSSVTSAIVNFLICTATSPSF